MVKVHAQLHALQVHCKLQQPPHARAVVHVAEDADVLVGQVAPAVSQGLRAACVRATKRAGACGAQVPRIIKARVRLEAQGLRATCVRAAGQGMHI